MAGPLDDITTHHLRQRVPINFEEKPFNYV